jgi:CubicO group peptidase (beta-lactamase class C family)
MKVANVYDYQHFENRTIKGSDQFFKFESKPDEAYVESLFDERVANSGFSSFDEWAEKFQTTALIFIQRDTILYEKYFNGFSRDSYFHSQSVAKSFVSFLIGQAIEEGTIKSIDDPMTDYIPELLDRDIRFGEITIRNLLEMRSGIAYNTSFLPIVNIHTPWNDEVVGYYHDNVRELLLEDIGIARAPGKEFEYCNYNTSYLGLIIERATDKTVSAFLEEKLWSRTMEYDALFSIDSKESGFEYMPSRLIARAIDYARFGRLYLNKGNMGGEQLVSQDWVEDSTEENKDISRDYYPEWLGTGCEHTYYSYQWWGNMTCDSSFTYFANGNLGQNIYVIPDKEVVIVHCGNSLQHYRDGDLTRMVDRIKP